ncbi:hypothetical protein B0J17DRAFT_641447 [Rhizoctonia solani]|nr:hypothetical protein B0J17DRAFT_641447 [Rhizoctonia solani]
MHRPTRRSSISSFLRLRRSREVREEAQVPRLGTTLVRPEPNAIRTYYTVAMALARGSLSRPGLPFELMMHICRLAGFEVLQTRKAPAGIKEVHAWSLKVESRLWFQTEQFTKEMLSHIKSIQLITMSHHQGFVGNRYAGSWSWFEIRIARSTEQDPSQFEVKHRPSGEEISQRSHSHPVDEETAEQQGDFAEHRGFVFGPGNPLWNEIEVGDVLQVMMKAQFSGWKNVASDGILKINRWWEPSPEMLELIYIQRC